MANQLIGSSRFIYAVNEFTVNSAVEIACDPQCADAENIDCVTFRRGSLANVPSTLRKIRRQLIYDVGDGFLLEPHVGADAVALHINLRGDIVTIDCPDERLPVAVAWAVHAGLGAATLTHGGLPLHAAGLELDGRYIGLMADSGVGKSTLLWYLLGQGARFGNDDLVPVRTDGETVTAYPARSLYPKLSREAVDRHGLNLADLLPADYGTGEEEYYAPLPAGRRVLTPLPLSAVLVLAPAMPRGCGNPECDCGGQCACKADEVFDGAGEEVTCRRLEPDEAADTLMSNLHAVWLIGKWMDGRKLRARCREVTERVPVYTVTYRRSFDVLPVLHGTIRQVLARETAQ